MGSGAWNIFRLMGDLSHLASKAILVFAIHRNRSAEGVSLITQILYAVVFCTRYLDIFHENSQWNLFFKIIYISSSLYIIGIMQWIYPRTREREISWKIGAACLAVSAVIAPFAMMLLESHWGFLVLLWDFSEVLESVCVLPQLLLLRQTTIPTVIDSFYLLALASYRTLYVLNWVYRGVDPSNRPPNKVSVIFGVIQTLLYLDFFWCYYTRPRVRLRNGGIVDAQDYQRGWLIGRIIGNNVRVDHDDDDEESAPALGPSDQQPGTVGRSARPKWGSRGISVSADDGVLETDRLNSQHEDHLDEGVDPDAKMRDPDDLARVLDDDDDDDAPLPTRNAGVNGESSGVRRDEWDD